MASPKCRRRQMFNKMINNAFQGGFGIHYPCFNCWLLCCNHKTEIQFVKSFSSDTLLRIVNTFVYSPNTNIDISKQEMPPTQTIHREKQKSNTEMVWSVWTCSKDPSIKAIVQRLLLRRCRIPRERKAFHTNMFSYGIFSSFFESTFRCTLCMMQ